MKSATLTLLAIPLAGWLALSTSFATEVDAKAGTETGKTTVQTDQKKGKSKKAAEERIPLCGPGSMAVEGGPTAGGHWEKAQSAGKAACQQPAAKAADQAGSAPVNTLEDIYVAASASEVLAPVPPPAPAPPAHSDKPR